MAYMYYIQHKWHSAYDTFSITMSCHYSECCYSECWVLVMIMLNVVMLNVVPLLLLNDTLRKFSGVKSLQVLLIWTNGQNQPTPFSLSAVLLSLSPQISLSVSLSLLRALFPIIIYLYSFHIQTSWSACLIIIDCNKLSEDTPLCHLGDCLQYLHLALSKPHSKPGDPLESILWWMYRPLTSLILELIS